MNGKPIEQSLCAVVPGSPVDRLASLFDMHYSRLYRLARRLSPSADDARDLVQETFFKAARALRSIPFGTAGEEAWLVRVLVNIRRDQWRKQSIRERYQEAQRGNGRMRAEGPDTEAMLIDRVAVWQGLQQLPLRRRAIVILSELEGLKESEISALLGIRGVTVRWHLHRGKRDLNRMFQAHIGGAHEKS